MKIWLRATWFLLVAVVAAGCARDAATDQTLTVWAVGREAQVVRQLAPEFERLHPGVRVRVQELAWTAAHEKLLTAFAGDATPDVCQLGNTWIAEFQALDALEPLDERIRASRNIDPADYFSGVWATNVIGGTTYGVPWYVDTRLLFYRRDILAAVGFEQPPRTWDEWLAMLRAIKQHVGPDRYGVLLPLNEFEPLQVLALQQPEPMLRDGDRFGNFRSESFKRALGFYAQLFNEQLAPPATNAQISNVWLELGNGYFSFYLSGPWNVGEFKRRLTPEQQPTWMTASMPGPDGPGVSSAGGSSLVIFKRSPRKELAWQLIEFLSSAESQKVLNEVTGDLPTRRAAWSTSALQDDPYMRAFREQLERLRPAPQVPEWERIMQEMRYAAERVAHGEQTVDEAVAQLDQRVDALLEKRRWMLARNAVQ